MSGLFSDIASSIEDMLNGLDDIPVFEDERGKGPRPRVLAWMTTEQVAARQSEAHSTGKAKSSVQFGQRPDKAFSAPSRKASSVKLARTGVGAIGGKAAAPVVQAASHPQTIQGVLRPTLGPADPLSVFAKVAAMAIANDEDEERRRAGGGGGGGRPLASTRSFRTPNAAQALAARAAIAAGAQQG